MASDFQESVLAVKEVEAVKETSRPADWSEMLDVLFHCLELEDVVWCTLTDIDSHILVAYAIVFPFKGRWCKGCAEISLFVSARHTVAKNRRYFLLRASTASSAPGRK